MDHDSVRKERKKRKEKKKKKDTANVNSPVESPCCNLYNLIITSIVSDSSSTTGDPHYAVLAGRSRRCASTKECWNGVVASQGVAGDK